MTIAARLATALAASALVAVTVGAVAPADSTLGPQAAAADAAPFTLSWTQPVNDGADISTASPVVVDNGGNPIVVTGDLGGNLRAFRLSDGQPVPGWQSVNAGYEIKAPLSSDGTYVYVPVAQDGKDNYPKFNKYDANGRLVWSTANTRPQPPGVGFLLAGMPLWNKAGRWQAVGASSGHWIYGIDAADGRQQWAFRNADSTMGSPILADLYGLGKPQIITSNDKTAEFPPVSKNGGHIRIFTAEGRQICSADQPVEGNTHAYSGYNNSSPSVTEFGGKPLIVFGSTGPKQYGAGGNQVVAYDGACNLRWASPPLAEQVQVSPTLADVLGRGTPQVIEVVGIRDAPNRVYPRVYVLDPANGSIILDSGTSLSAHAGQIAYPPGIQIVTADVTGDGAQDLFVPAADLLVLDGKTLSNLSAIEMDGAIQNTPVITPEPGGGIRITFAGYQGNPGPFAHGSIIRSYVSRGTQVGQRGWLRFGGNSQLTGLQGKLNGPYDALVEGQELGAGKAIRSGRYTATMQPDGNLVIRRPDRSVVWATYTKAKFSRLRMDVNGQAMVIAPNGKVQWRSPATWLGVDGVERFEMGVDGRLRVLSASWLSTGTERTAKITTVWRS